MAHNHEWYPMLASPEVMLYQGQGVKPMWRRLDATNQDYEVMLLDGRIVAARELHLLNPEAIGGGYNDDEEDRF